MTSKMEKRQESCDPFVFLSAVACTENLTLSSEDGETLVKKHSALFVLFFECLLEQAPTDQLIQLQSSIVPLLQYLPRSEAQKISKAVRTALGNLKAESQLNLSLDQLCESLGPVTVLEMIPEKINRVNYAFIQEMFSTIDKPYSAAQMDPKQLSEVYERLLKAFPSTKYERLVLREYKAENKIYEWIVEKAFELFQSKTHELTAFSEKLQKDLLEKEKLLAKS
ncbi:MAG: hypothetical protein H0X51_06825 [Parachlamydiaceae bacterium]|nr:hypothetical protein [Parachlamydiaceae bacterium]